MKFELEVLDGTQKGQKIPVNNGLSLGQNAPLLFYDPEMSQMHAVASLDHKNSWIIECLAPNKLRLGSEEVARLALMEGLIFHIGQTGFKVIQRQSISYESWDEGLEDWLKNNPGKSVSSEIFFFAGVVRLTFVQGPQFEEFYTLSYGPRTMGFNSLDLNVKDPSVPYRFVRFYQIGEKAYIENFCGEKAKINGDFFDHHPILTGDRLSITSNVIELSILK